jgi:hypothetical protein
VVEELDPESHLPLAQSWFTVGRYVAPNRVRRYMARQGWSEPDLLGCIASLRDEDLHKIQEHVTGDGRRLYVYRPRYRGVRMYIKFTSSDDGRSILLLSFCRDGTAH